MKAYGLHPIATESTSFLYYIFWKQSVSGTRVLELLIRVFLGIFDITRKITEITG